jgi:hypothetical protein
MKNRVINIILKYGLDIVFVLILLIISRVLFDPLIGNYFFIVFLILLIVSVMPITSYFHDMIDSIVSPIIYEELFIQTVDSILNIESFDEVLKSTFDRILGLIHVKSGLLIFYFHDKDEFNIFYRRDKRKKVIRKARIENSNILFKIINGPDDVIIKNKLNKSIHFEKTIIEEMEKLNGEVVIPIYYHDMFLGLIVIGDRKRRFSNREMRLLKVFASRIAILSVNSFFFNELLKKKEVEKEYEIASKIQKRFLPDADARIGRIAIKVFHETASLMTREFYDIFVNDLIEDDVRISAYRLLGNITGTSIYMPGIQALLQSFSRLGLPPSRGVMKLQKIIREGDIIQEDISIFHSSIRQNGEFTFCNSNYQSPLIYRRSSKLLRRIEGEKKGATNRLKIQHGDVLVIACKSFFNIINSDIKKFSEITVHNASSLSRMSTALVKNLTARTAEDDEDKLLVLLSVEEVS